MNNSLMKILNDPSLLINDERLREQTEKVEKDKKRILGSAQDYNNKYQTEIDEGTKKRQLLIADAHAKGLDEAEVLKGNFIPCRSTPVLNWLYFMLREDNIDLEAEEARKKYNAQYGHLQDDYDSNQSTNFHEPESMDDLIYGNCSNEVFKKIKKLKTLSQDCCNENEAFIAYRMAIELCKKYNLEFDKIPVYRKQ